jgi:hypothetical protein
VYTHVLYTYFEFIEYTIPAAVDVVNTIKTTSRAADNSLPVTHNPR